MADSQPDITLLSRVEDVSLNAAAPPQQRWMDGWLLRYCPGKARRSRCINALAPGRLPLPDKLQAAARLFQQAGVPMVFRVTRFTQPPDLDDQLAALGWPAVDPTRVLVRPELQALTLPAMPAELRWRQLAPEAFAEAVGHLRGTLPADRLSHAQRLAAAPVPHAAYVIERASDGEVLACGQTAQEDEFVGVYDVQTAQASRRLGLASLLCERMLSYAASNGATTAYLQVQADNEAALRIYRRLGFGDGYGYHYREAPQRA